MSEKFKLGLTRNRLFALENTVIFTGEYAAAFDEAECAKAMKMLSVKEPITTAAIELCEDSSAYIVTDKCDPCIVFSDDPISDVVERYERVGLDFSERLFEFTVCGGNTLVIAAHTVACDSKSLLRLAMEFVRFYTRKSVSVDPSEIVTFPDMQSLPAKLNSPIIDKLSADIESKWRKTLVSFGASDCKRAIEKYASEKTFVGSVEMDISSEDCEALSQYCGDNNIDLSSLIAYGFYDALVGKVNVSKKARKMSAYSDRRLFVSDMERCSVGAFNGYVDISFKDKGAKSAWERMKAFHVARYKGVTSPFRSFYDELLLMKLPPQYCDASYMNVAGCYSSSAARRLADNYGCNDSRVMAYFSCDMRQEYWSDLSFFENVAVFEPFVRRFCAMVDSFITDEGVRAVFRYNKAGLTSDQASEIVSLAQTKIREFLP